MLHKFIIYKGGGSTLHYGHTITHCISAIHIKEEGRALHYETSPKLKSELIVAKTTLTKDSRQAEVRTNSGQKHQRIQGKLKAELIVAQTTLTKDSRQAKVRANSCPNHINKRFKAS